MSFRPDQIYTHIVAFLFLNPSLIPRHVRASDSTEL